MQYQQKMYVERKHHHVNGTEQVVSEYAVQEVADDEMMRAEASVEMVL